MPNSKIGAIGVLTCNSPEQLDRCTTSFGKNFRAFNRTPEFVVMDDSKDEAMRDQNQKVLKEKTNADTVFRYSSIVERKLFFKELQKKTQIDTDLLNFALGEVDYSGYRDGANRNALFLDQIGERFVSTDDDVICRLSGPSIDPTEPILSAVTDPGEVTLFETEADLLGAQIEVNADFLGLHEKLLGSSVKDGGTVDLTSNGYYGDAGVRFPSFYLWNSEETRRQLIKESKRYRRLVLSRKIHKAARTLTVTPGGHIQSVLVGYNASTPLPPYVPVMRGSDLIFGIATKRLLSNSRTAYLPWSAYHAPLKQRINDQETMGKEASRFTLMSIMRICIDIGPDLTSIASIEDRFKQLSRHLIALGNENPRKFSDLIRSHLTRFAQAKIKSLEDLIASHPEGPDYWVKDIQNFIDGARFHLSQDYFHLPADMISTPDALLNTQLIVKNYGELVGIWNEIRRESRRLREAGFRMSRVISKEA